MVDLLTQSIVGAVANDLLSLVREALKKSFYCKTYCKRLEKTLEKVIPMLDEVFQTGSEQISQHRLKHLMDFHERLKNGTELVKSCSRVKRYNIYQNHKYAKKILALEKYIINFNPGQGWVHALCDLQHLRADMREGVDQILQLIQDGQELRFPQQMMIDQMDQLQINEEITNSSLQIPDLPEFPVGLQISVDDLRKRLFLKDVSLLAVKGMGGSGKTTLAIALCTDSVVKGYFKERIIYVTVSQSPNLKGTIERMWDKIVRSRRPDFHNVEDARINFQQVLRQRKYGPTLVVLDDVWNKDHLEKLMFEAEGYKTVITTRNSIVEANYQYDLHLLREADALSLFCFWAFKQQTIPEAQDEDLVKQVVAECKGLPLALKVIGSSLQNKCPAVWKDGRDRLSRAQSISDYHKDGLLKCMETSVDILEEEVQDCFLDLGSFPEDRKNSVAALLDLWVYVHELDWEAAYANLIELKSRNLVTLVDSPTDRFGNLYGSSCEHFIQHDVLRDLAIYLTEKELINRRKRLIMPRMENSVPTKWKKLADCSFNAEIVSLHTGTMNEEDWCPMNCPKAEALVLNFSASEYFLPPFLETMHKLKVLIIVNHNSKRATLKGLSVLSSLSQLKSVRLERVIVPPLQEYCQSWQKLEKLSLILCEGCDHMNGIQTGLCLNLPHLVEVTIDHCSNLEELPANICNTTSLRNLSVTNCHDLYKLSDDLGKLSSLQMLRLCACLSLKELPSSICKLKQLKFLDISLCEFMQQLPDEFGQLSRLERLDMRECSHVKQLPKSASGLRSLVYVICDENIGQQWSAIKASNIPRLNVEVAEEHFHLDWLED